MKKLTLLFIGVLYMPIVNAQDITDALRYSQDEILGTARYRAMSGAFGALGGDMSAVSINPAGSAIFNTSHASFSISSLNTKNETQYFNGFDSSSNSDIDFHQVGAVFVFRSSNSPWKKLTTSIAYDKVKNYNNDWFAFGNNTNSIDSYFLSYGQGLRLDEISAFPDESITEAYGEIGSTFGFGHQQAFLGYESYILEPETNDDANTTYFSNISGGDFDQEFSYSTTGYNGKVAFNAATQYKDKLFLGVNLNSHFLDYRRSTYFFEGNSNLGSVINEVGFENSLRTIGAGFSFQLGGILKLTEQFRVGLSYNSPTWFTLEDETTQYIVTYDSDANITQIVDPLVVNVFPRYDLQTPGKLTGSLAFVFKERGIISFDYSQKDYGNTKFKPTSDPHLSSQNNMISNNLTVASTYKIGGEYKHNQFSFRGGYRFEESPYKNESTVGDLSGYSFGLGYNFGNMKLDVTFDQSKRDSKYRLFDVGLTDAASIDATNSNVTLSLSFNI